MIQLTIEPIQPASQSHLDTKQNDVNGMPAFPDKVERASALWDRKTGTKAGKEAFKDIKNTLIYMCIGVEICNYCENNEATDIEHLFPKRLYPEVSFEWNNYILACKTCNTTWKSDRFAILNPAGSNNLFEISRQTNAYHPPPNNDSAMINPRAEDPLYFLLLDIKGKTFRFSAYPGISNRDAVRAAYTLNLLGLNNRDALVEARRAAANYYLDRLEKYIRVRDASSMTALENITSDSDAVDINSPLNVEKDRIKTSIINDIRQYAHPTVWEELKRQRNQLHKTNLLFNNAPEALNW